MKWSNQRYHSKYESSFPKIYPPELKHSPDIEWVIMKIAHQLGVGTTGKFWENVFVGI